MRVEALAGRPADGLRRIAEPVLFFFATQVIIHAVWTGFSLPEAALPAVLEAAFFSFWLSRFSAIARLATLYRVTAGADVSLRVSPAPAAARARG